MNMQDVATSVAWWLLLSMILWVFNRHNARVAETKFSAEHQEELKKRRARDDGGRLTAIESLKDEMRAAHTLWSKEESWPLKSNTIFARNLLDDDLGKFAERYAHFDLDEATRDILLAHARRDAAEALLNTRTLLEQSHARQKSYREMYGQVYFFAIVFVLYSWWQSNFALWPWLQRWLNG